MTETNLLWTCLSLLAFFNVIMCFYICKLERIYGSFSYFKKQYEALLKIIERERNNKIQKDKQKDLEKAIKLLKKKKACEQNGFIYYKAKVNTVSFYYRVNMDTGVGLYLGSNQ